MSKEAVEMLLRAGRELEGLSYHETPEFQAIEEYVKSWENDEFVHSVIMGGFDDAYELIIQNFYFTILRIMIDMKYDPIIGDEKNWNSVRNSIEASHEYKQLVKTLQPSGSQIGAAMSLAYSVYTQSLNVLMNKEIAFDRYIKVNKTTIEKMDGLSFGMSLNKNQDDDLISFIQKKTR